MACVTPGRDDLQTNDGKKWWGGVIQLSMIGLAVALSCLFTAIAGWQQVARLFCETEQERIDRQFFALVSTIDLDV